MKCIGNFNDIQLYSVGQTASQNEKCHQEVQCTDIHRYNSVGGLRILCLHLIDSEHE